MKLLIESKKLLKALVAVAGAVPTKTTLPVLSYLHVVSDGNSLLFSASDLEITLQVKVPDVECEPFVALLPARRLLDIVKSYPTDKIVGLSQEDQEKMIVKCGRSRFSLQTLDEQDYPLLDHAEYEQEFVLSQESLLQCLTKVEHAVAKNDVRYYLNGVFLHGNENGINFVATNGHRLAKTQIIQPLGCSDFDAILPIDSIHEIKKSCEESDCVISVCNNLVRFVFENKTVIVKKIDGKFPDYKRIIPNNLDHKIKIDRTLLFEALTRVRLVLKKGESAVLLKFTTGMLTLSCGEKEDYAEDQMDVDYDGDELIVSINVNYLIDALVAIQSKQIIFCCVNARSVIRILNTDQLEDAFVVMPLTL